MDLTSSKQDKGREIVLVYLAAFIFIVINVILLLQDVYLGFLIPLFAVVFALFIFSPEKTWMLAVCATPLSIFVEINGLESRVSFPGEILLAGITLVVVMKLILNFRFDRQFMHHPVTILIVAVLVWMLFTVVSSEMPLVSLKYFLARLWFVIPMYFAGAYFFRKPQNIRLFLWLYAVPLFGVFLYTTWQHSMNGFTERSGHWVMDPFYNDHTAYGAIMAMFIPVMAVMLTDKKLKLQFRIFSGLLVIAFLTGLILSGSRAAWLSFAVSALICLLVLIKIRMQWIMGIGIAILLLFWGFREPLLSRIDKNRQTASENRVLHVKSIVNITTDASNLERINRWKSAIRMFKERPVVGWGPGTYQFVYAPFQFSREKTIISTDLGDVGSVHSEYLGPLSEMGLPGFLLFITLSFVVVFRGFRIYETASSGFVKYYALAVTLALITYFVHGCMNNFLETDKLSVPFWAMLAIITTLDIQNAGMEGPEI